MSRFNPQKIHTLRPETLDYLADWLEWVENTPEPGNRYSRKSGLCDNVVYWPKYHRHGERVGLDLHYAFDGENFPFGDDEYDIRSECHTQHEQPERLAWVRLQLTQPRRQLEERSTLWRRAMALFGGKKTP